MTTENFHLHKNVSDHIFCNLRFEYRRNKRRSPPVIAGIDDYAFHNAGKQKPRRSEFLQRSMGGNREARTMLCQQQGSMRVLCRTRNFNANF